MERARWGGIYYFEESSHQLFSSPNLTSCIYCYRPRAPEAAASITGHGFHCFCFGQWVNMRPDPGRWVGGCRGAHLAASSPVSPSGPIYINDLSNRHSCALQMSGDNDRIAASPDVLYVSVFIYLFSVLSYLGY